MSDILKQFHHVIRTVPSNGNILFHDSDKNIIDLIEMGCWSNTHKLGGEDNLKLSIEEGIIHFNDQQFDVNDLPMHGRHNLNNVVMAMYTSFLYGVDPQKSFQHLRIPRELKEDLKQYLRTVTK